MAIYPYVSFSGNCREAIQFYADVFQTSQQPIITYGEGSPGEAMPEALKNWVMHTELSILGNRVMFSDTPKKENTKVNNSISLVISLQDEQMLKTIFERLQAGGVVSMPLQPTFWTKLYGYVTDRFGIGWQISYEDAQPVAPSSIDTR